MRLLVPTECSMNTKSGIGRAEFENLFLSIGLKKSFLNCLFKRTSRNGVKATARLIVCPDMFQIANSLESMMYFYSGGINGKNHTC